MLRSSYQRALQPLVLAVNPVPIFGTGLRCGLLLVAAHTPTPIVTLRGWETPVSVKLPDAYLNASESRSYRNVTLEVVNGD